MGTFAVDGTKVKANASMSANWTWGIRRMRRAAPGRCPALRINAQVDYIGRILPFGRPNLGDIPQEV